MDINEEKYIVATNMKKFGGSFVKCLGETLFHADPINTKKIKETWFEYWKNYLGMILEEDVF